MPRTQKSTVKSLHEIVMLQLFQKTGAVRVKNSVTRAGYDVEIARNRISEVVSPVLHALIVLHVHREIVARSPGSMTR